MKSILVNKEESNISFSVGVEEMVYKTDINSFIENTGVTIQNINFPISEYYYVKLSEYGKTFVCGNIIDNLFGMLKKNNIENSLLIVDFEGVEELTDSFFKSYTKILLETSNKIITINMNTALSNDFSAFILTNITEIDSEDVEE